MPLFGSKRPKMYIAELSPSSNLRPPWMALDENFKPKEVNLVQSKKTDEKGDEKKNRWQPLLDYFYLFFQSSNIHGFYQLTVSKRHWVEYALWGSLIIGGIMCSVSMSSQSWRRYKNDPTVISIERDYKNWLATLPALTLCPKKHVDELALEKFLKKYREERRPHIKKFLEKLSSVRYENLETVDDMEVEEIKPDNYTKYIWEVAHHFQGEGVPTLWDTKYTENISELGICHSYNSAIAVYFWPEFFFYKMSKKIHPEGSPNLTSGLPDDGYLEYSIRNFNGPVKVYFSAAENIPDVTSKPLKADWGQFTFIQFLTVSTIGTPEIRSLSLEQRKCRYIDESNLKISRVYSYTHCRMNCRWKEALRLCQCVPHFYRKVDNVKICNMKGLMCLAKHKDLLIKLRHPGTDEKVKCDCLPPCNAHNYFPDGGDALAWFNSANIEFSIKKYPRIRYRREVIFGFTELLISVGGVSGLFLGCSMLSFVEIFYFMTLRLFFYVRKNKALKAAEQLDAATKEISQE